MEILEILPRGMRNNILTAANVIKQTQKATAISHIDADGIASIAIVLKILERAEVEHSWLNIHQLNSETIENVRNKISETKPTLVIFSDLGTGQRKLIEELVETVPYLQHVIILDHHLPQKEYNPQENKIIEINPHHHGISGSFEISGAGVAFLLAMAVDVNNFDLSELAVVGATGDLQRYYGEGFVGINKEIVTLAQRKGILRLKKDLTFFGIHTRPLPFLLEYCTEPYLPGITGERDACFAFFESIGIPLKEGDKWRVWTDLTKEEKSRAVRALVELILLSYPDPKIAQGIIGEVVELLKRPARSELRNAKEFATLLNACGRNSKPEIGVKICLGDEKAFRQGRALLQVHRQNLANALKRIGEGGYQETEGMYLIDDPETPDTIIGIVLGMAQGSRIVPSDKPVIGIAKRVTNHSDYVKISGRARKEILEKGINLKDVFSSVARHLNDKYARLVVEAGGHPMAAGAFVKQEVLDEFLTEISDRFREKLVGLIRQNEWRSK